MLMTNLPTAGIY